MNTQTPARPTLETCAHLVLAAKRAMDESRDHDEDAFDEARTAYLRAHQTARAHGYVPSEITRAVEKLNQSL